jgi:hypothetical protein
MSVTQSPGQVAFGSVQFKPTSEPIMAQAPGRVHASTKQQAWSQELPDMQAPPLLLELELELAVLPPLPLLVVVAVVAPLPPLPVPVVSSTSEPQAAADAATANPMKPTVSTN